MKKKIAWLVVSCLMALSLVMASCAPAAVEEEEEEEVVVEEEVEEEVVAPAVEKPKYGGTLKLAFLYANDTISDFDPVTRSQGYKSVTQHLTYEPLWMGDWTKGNAGGYGTNEADWTAKVNIVENDVGALAESWELPAKIEGDTATTIWHIRKGVHFGLNPASEASRLVAGREMTVDDVLYSLNRQVTDKTAYIYKGNPELRVAKITSPAPWTVKIEVSWETYSVMMDRFPNWPIIPREVGEKYDTTNWKHAVGTGPFMLTDFVAGTAATMAKNSDYWMKDPIGPGKGNQLPYLDAVKWIIIPDKSTQFAAMRTAKVDWLCGMMTGVSWEEATAQLLNNTPQIVYAPLALGNAQGGALFKIGRPPFNDIRVRRAMLMAIDFESIKDSYFGGEAQILTWPITYQKDYAGAYLGLDDPEMPASVKELYSYNPEKARALLAEAGYPQGFKTNLVLVNSNTMIDYFSMYVDFWKKVGIDVELSPKEDVAINTVHTSHDFDAMFADSSTNTWQLFQMRYYWGTGVDNMAEINDPVVNEVQPKIQLAAVEDRAEAFRMHKELMKHLLDQAYAIPMVTPNSYTFWWPWVKNYSGELNVKTQGANFPIWVWLDQELKKSMGY